METEKAEESVPTKVFYALHNISRAKSSRTHRAQAAVHPRKKHYLGDSDLRLLPARRQIVSEDVLMKHLTAIQERVSSKVLEVRTLDGRLLDLATFQPGPAEPTPLLPHPRLDSVAHDIPTGQYIPPYVGDDTSMPVVLPPGEKPALLQEETEEPHGDVPNDELEEDLEAEEEEVPEAADELSATIDAAREESSALPTGSPSSGRKNRRGRK